MLGLKYVSALYLTVFQVVFIVLMGIYADYNLKDDKVASSSLYSMYQDVHTMMFIGFGFLMTFLRRYGYSSVGFNFLICVYVTEWSLLIRGWFEEGMENHGMFEISVENLLVADFCTAAVLISFGAVLGKTSPIQLLIMATIEVVIQSVNEWIGLHFFKAYDVGESIYVHVFGAYFGLAVAKVLHNEKVHSHKEEAIYHSDLFAMIGTLFLWLFWPSFNSAVAVGNGQTRAIVNTVLSISSSAITTFIISNLVGRGRLNMVHIQNATLAGGVAVGAIADMNIHPFGAMIIGSFAGIMSTLGFQYLTPLLKRVHLHDTCGVHNLHGMPGVLSGIISAIVAATTTRASYQDNDLYKFYPSMTPQLTSADYIKFRLNETVSYKDGGLGRTASIQAGYQLAALALTLGIAIASGTVTGFILKLPIIQKIKKQEDLFDDSKYWELPIDTPPQSLPSFASISKLEFKEVNF